jgi:hypothetical protein
MIIGGLIIIAVGFVLGGGIISVGLWREAKMPLPEATTVPDLKGDASQPTTPAKPTSAPAAIPRAQPYRMTNNHLRPDRQAIVRVSDNATISLDKNDADFKIYIAWLAANNMPDPAEATLAPVYAARSPSDAEKEIPIVDKLYELIHTSAAPLPEKGVDLIRGWSVIIAYDDQSASYTREADKFFYGLQEVNNKIIAMARDNQAYCANDLCAIVGGASKNDFDLILAIGEFEIAFNSLSSVIDRDKYVKNSLPSLTPDDPDFLTKTVNWGHFRDLLSLRVERINQLLTAYGVWVAWAEHELLERRDQLSKIASRPR